ncbi:MAG: hypothetical protein R3C39_05370 [Dehalococcoidia bacterium]
MQDVPTITELLSRLPWFRDLTSEHRRQMVEQISACMTDTMTREQYAGLLEEWAVLAHRDQKWARFELLRESGLLAR